MGTPSKGDPLLQAFPGLAVEGYQVTSPADPSYNCIAWAAGDDRRWWEPAPLGGFYWPPGLPRGSGEYTMDNYKAAFAQLGFQECSDSSLEAGVEKVAIFAVGGQPKHAARQLASGWWTSKLGRVEDIAHTLKAVEGNEYGIVAMLLARPRP